MSLEFILLGMLREPRTGYDLKTEFAAGAAYFWSAELAQIYPALQAMEKKGWLRSRRAPSKKGPPRRVYERTAGGTKEFKRWLAGEPIMGVERFAYIAQLVWHAELDDLGETLRFLEQLRAKQAALKGILQGVLDGLASLHPEGERTMNDQEFHEWLALEMGARAVAARVAWCDEARTIVRMRANRESRTAERNHV
jgi:DNA-binding PadR family transcriptional regulator